MGCGSSIEDQVLLAKLDRLEIQVKKEKELKKLSEIEGRPIGSMNQYSGFDTRTERNRRLKTTPNDRNFDAYTSKDKSRKKKNGSEKKSKKKKDKDEKSKKKTRAISEGVTKKKKKKK